MPPNMMNALIGSRPKVMGSRTATVIAGPMPGSTPTAVPRVTPASAQARCARVNAFAKPSPKACSVSISGRSQPAGEQPWGQRQLQYPGEEQVCRDGEPGGVDGVPYR